MQAEKVSKTVSSLLTANRKEQARLSDTWEAWPGRPPACPWQPRPGRRHVAPCPFPSTTPARPCLGDVLVDPLEKTDSEFPSLQLPSCWLQSASVPRLSHTAPVQTDKIAFDRQSVHKELASKRTPSLKAGGWGIGIDCTMF